MNEDTCIKRTRIARLWRGYHQPVDEHVITENNTFILGREALSRESRNYGILCNSLQVSRKHCKIFYKHGTFRIKDLQSKTGTWLNGENIKDHERELRHRDTVAIGRSPITASVQDKDCFFFNFEEIKLPPPQSYPDQGFPEVGPHFGTENLATSSCNVSGSRDRRPSVEIIDVKPAIRGEKNTPSPKNKDKTKKGDKNPDQAQSSPPPFRDSGSDSDATVSFSPKNSTSSQRRSQKPGPASFHRQSQKTRTTHTQTFAARVAQDGAVLKTSMSKVEKWSKIVEDNRPLHIPSYLDSNTCSESSDCEDDSDDGLADTRAKRRHRNKLANVSIERKPFKISDCSSKAGTSGTAQPMKNSKSIQTNPQVHKKASHHENDLVQRNIRSESVPSKLPQDNLKKVSLSLTPVIVHGRIGEKYKKKLSWSNQKKIYKQLEAAKKAHLAKNADLGKSKSVTDKQIPVNKAVNKKKFARPLPPSSSSSESSDEENLETSHNNELPITDSQLPGHSKSFYPNISSSSTTQDPAVNLPSNAQSPRTIQLLPRAPTPPYVRRQQSRCKMAQGKICSEIHQNHKDTLKDKLKALAEKERLKTKLAAEAVAHLPKVAHAPMFVKNTKNSRNEKLTKDMMPD